MELVYNSLFPISAVSVLIHDYYKEGSNGTVLIPYELSFRK